MREGGGGGHDFGGIRHGGEVEWSVLVQVLIGPDNGCGIDRRRRTWMRVGGWDCGGMGLFGVEVGLGGEHLWRRGDGGSGLKSGERASREVATMSARLIGGQVRRVGRGGRPIAVCAHELDG